MTQDIEITDEECFWFTLGQCHSHLINDMTFDRDTVIELAGGYEETRNRMFELCGDKWSHQYERGGLNLSHFPRGVHRL